MAKIESKIYELTCIAPVHIGSGEKLKKYDYICDNRAGVNKAYFIDHGRLAKLLAEENLLDEFSFAMMNRKIYDLGYWLRNERVNPKKIAALTTHMAEIAMSPKKGKEKDPLNDLAVQTTLADGRPYIPGSSIKGAMRTAIIYHLLQQNTRLKEKYWQLVKNDIKNNYSRKLRFIAADLENELLSKLNFADSRGRRSDNAVQSVMRGIVVGDAILAGSSETIIIGKTDITTKIGKNGNKENNLPIARECLPSRARLRFKISLDSTITSAIGLGDIATLIKWCHEYNEFGIKLLDKAFGKKYQTALDEAKAVDLAIGGGTGFLNKTIFYALAPSDTEGRNLLTEFLDSKFTTFDRRKHKKVPAHNHRIEDTIIAPRTLKLAKTKEEHFLMGICSLQEVKNAH